MKNQNIYTRFVV